MRKQQYFQLEQEADNKRISEMISTTTNVFHMHQDEDGQDYTGVIMDSYENIHSYFIATREGYSRKEMQQLGGEFYIEKQKYKALTKGNVFSKRIYYAVTSDGYLYGWDLSKIEDEYAEAIEGLPTQTYGRNTRKRTKAVIKLPTCLSFIHFQLPFLAERQTNDFFGAE